MAIVLTNGKFYIAHSGTGGVIKVQYVEQAQDFHSVQRGINQRNKAPGKCSGYYILNTDTGERTDLKNIPIPEKKKKKSTVKRKSFSPNERKLIYKKTNGHCYLCGEFVDFDSFEVEHKVPLSKGGTNDLSNTFCACHCCNTIKHDIYPRDFMDKISQIFMYQMQLQNGSSLRWKIINRELSKML